MTDETMDEISDEEKTLLFPNLPEGFRMSRQQAAVWQWASTYGLTLLCDDCNDLLWKLGIDQKAVDAVNMIEDTYSMEIAEPESWRVIREAVGLPAHKRDEQP